MSRMEPIAQAGVRHVFIRNLELLAHIGVYRHEEGKMQPVRINVDLSTEDRADTGDLLEQVVDYAAIEKGIRAIIAEGHVRLVETLAERCAAIVLGEFKVPWLRLKLAKPGAVRGSQAVGVVIERGTRPG